MPVGYDTGLHSFEGHMISDIKAATDLILALMHRGEERATQERALHAVLRILDVETSANIDVLRRFQLGAKSTHAEYRPLGAALETTAHEATLALSMAKLFSASDAGKESTGWISGFFNSATGRVEEADEWMSEAELISKDRTPIRALRAVCIKVRTLRALAATEEITSEHLKPVRYGVRLRNILENEELIASALRDHEQLWLE